MLARLLLTSILLLTATGVSAADDWLLASGTGTCSASDVDFSDPRHGFAAGSFNCGLTSDDGGLNWSAIEVIPEQGQSLLWARAGSTSELWAARRGLYRSTDRGATWVELGGLSEGSGNIQSVAFIDADQLLMDKGDQIQRSGDGGISWNVVYPGEFGVAFNQLHVPTAQIAYATGGRGAANTGSVLRSDDGGLSWTVLDFPHGNITAAVFLDAERAIAATQNLEIYTTSDGAQSWQLTGSLPGELLTDLGLRDERHLYGASIDGCLYESFDAGHSWPAAAWCDPAARSLNSVSTRGGAVVAAGNEGLVIWENRIFVDGVDGS
jgi:photosystem II stability/assembly factor-like uncharacterized protein